MKNLFNLLCFLPQRQPFNSITRREYFPPEEPNKAINGIQICQRAREITGGEPFERGAVPNGFSKGSTDRSPLPARSKAHSRDPAKWAINRLEIGPRQLWRRYAGNVTEKFRVISP